MNRLEQLIFELCPNGVEYRALGEVCEILVGGDKPKQSYSPIKSMEYPIPIISNGVGERAIAGYTNIARVDKECVTVSARGTIGYSEYRNYPFYPIVRLICLVPNQTVLASYLNYYLHTITIDVPESNIKQLTSKDMESLKIPLPPLKIQNEIVRILDTFNELDSNLKQELQLRKKQYNYYRDLLLDFKDIEKKDHYSNSFYSPCHSEYSKESHIFKIDSQNKNPKKESVIIESKTHNQDSKISNIFKDSQNNKSNNTESKHTIKAILERKSYPKKLKDLLLRLCPYGVEYRSISSFATCVTGATPNTSRLEYWENGTISWMSSGEVNKKRIIKTEKKITESGYKNSSTKMLPKHTIVIALAGQGKTRGLVAITEIELCTNQSLCGIITNHEVLSKYLYYYLSNCYEHLRSISSAGSNRGGLNLQMIRSYLIPIPPLEIQNEIVRILDKFETLTNDLTTGIPAEIALRKKQYEYYRNKLLSFRELEKE